MLKSVMAFMLIGNVAMAATVEPGAIINDRYDSKALNVFATLIRANGWKCDSISSAIPFFWSDKGVTVSCNRDRYTYSLQDKGGRAVVTLED